MTCRDNAAGRIDELVRGVVTGMVQENRRGLAHWALRALPRLPKTVQKCESIWMLAVGASARLGQPILGRNVPTHAVHSWLPWVLPEGMPTVRLGVRLYGGSLELGPPGPERSAVLEVPRTHPLLVQVSWQRRMEQQSVLARLEPGETCVVPIGPGDLELRTGAGMVYRLSRQAKSGRRTIRVYVCSTLRDMQAERDHLTRVVFPRLREHCVRHGLHLVNIDLGWRFSQEMTHRDPLEAALNEIDRCRPFFIGLVGDRYGWIPETIHASLLQHWPWLADMVGRSTLEIEIEHGALANQGAATAFFYVRHPHSLESLPAGKRADSIDSDPDLRARLANLKQRIQSCGLPVCHYDDLGEFGRRVEGDLWTRFKPMIGNSRPMRDSWTRWIGK